MEEDQEFKFKHACKFCNKSFPCGRSLGGHMRSHIINMSASETQEKETLLLAMKMKMKKVKKKTKKPSSSTTNNGEGEGEGFNGSEVHYGLRENPKKTWRIANSSEENFVYDKFCKECGKSFHSWKALFGHMKCHSEKERVCNSLEDQDSWTSNNNANANANANDSSHTQKIVLDTQSDNEITAPNKRKRSKRRRTRYMAAAAAATSSVVSFANPSSSSVSEVEQEQEEVAMSLMMLSRDVSPWSGLHSLAESSDNNSVYFEQPRSSVRTNLVTKFDTNNIAKLIKENNFKGKSSELLDTETGFRMNKSGVSIKGFLKATKSELDYMSALVDSEREHERSRVNGTESVLSKYLDSELKSSSVKNWVNKSHEGHEFSKRGKFECTTCNKIFHSYQALGGHRASHRKIKGCFASKTESSEVENIIETDHHSPDPTTESKLQMMKNSTENSEEVHYEAEIVKESKKNKVHECPICLKVFQSGQALGGHKRSHMTGGSSESRNFQTVVIEEPVVHEIRDFLDLNLPAANDEESNSHADSNRPWWAVVEGNHKQEASCLAS